ncbi:MAG: RsbRD N-terminal domain-containing protein [Terracidiphilus sp.]|nr:RsbRD N-terminal domain-containing protein [Terracidiphilus sp.]MDR3796940.1 RsbRD N-terminal domain-containing protein [Terracidiphilus sp.]
MSVSGAIAEIVAERWIERTLASYPAEAHALLCGETDPFRNPAGHAIKQSLTTLAHELLGEMEESAIATALDALVRLRAVQDFRPSDALRFIFDLRDVVVEVIGAPPQALEIRIDEMALMAFDQYMACRDQIAGLREKELRLRMQCAAK